MMLKYEIIVTSLENIEALQIEVVILIFNQITKFNFKINFITNGLEKYMNFDISNRLLFINSV